MKLNIINVTWLTLLFSAIISLISAFFNIYIVNITTDSIRNISTTIIAASGSFIGFIVIYLSISYENFKKSYGQYAADYFGKDRVISSLLLLFIVVILLNLISLIYGDTKGPFSKWLFNTSCIDFALAIGLLIPYANTVIKSPGTNSKIQKLIDSLTLSSFSVEKNDSTDDISAFEILEQENQRSSNIIANLVYANIQEKNGKTSNAILLSVFKKIESLLKSTEENKEKLNNAISWFAALMQNSYDLYNINRDFIGIKTILALTNSCNKAISEKNLGKEGISKIFEVIIYISKKAIEQEDETQSWESLWAYYHMCEYLLKKNTPPESEIWNSDGEELLEVTSYTNFDPYSKFSTISEITTYRLNEVIERSFLCKNYHITEDCIRVLSSFAEMILFNQNLGVKQKDDLGSSLIYYSLESIKRFSESRTYTNTSPLHLYIGKSYIPEALKENTPFANSIFESYLELTRFLTITGKLSIHDAGEIGGLCRIILAQRQSIPKADEYAKQIIKLQQFILDKCSRGELQNAKKVSDIIKDDFRSYQSKPQSNTGDPEISKLIQGF